jgi:hypothetical protein
MFLIAVPNLLIKNVIGSTIKKTTKKIEFNFCLVYLSKI